MRPYAGSLVLALALACRFPTPDPAAASPPPAEPAWAAENLLRPLPQPPLGIDVDLAAAGVTPEKARLGRWLFFDRRLSADGNVSCATCHRPENAFSEPLPVSRGIAGKTGTRKAPPIVNAAFPIYPVFFWDGRARSLAEQAKGPLANPIEMGNSHESVVATVAGVRGYRRYFREAFGDDRIDIDRIGEAIAAYEATRLSGNSAYDRFEAGDDRALSELAQRGRDVFFGEGRCNACHLGQSFTDSRFHNLGVGYAERHGARDRGGFADVGRHAVTREERDLGAFKTPTLRDVSRRAPYMHDGSMETLEDVVAYYVRGGNDNPWMAPEMDEVRVRPRDIPALVEFLRALDGEGYADTAPRLFPE